MSKEIERKFLIKDQSFKKESLDKNYIVQGYLNSNPNRAVRIRAVNKKGYITIKGIGNDLGTTRFEWEKEIPIVEAEQLLNLCEKEIIEKYRYRVVAGNHIFEVDEFLGENEGLYIAEVELQHEDEKFDIPVWLGKEVTGIDKYYNVMLMKNPFKKW